MIKDQPVDRLYQLNKKTYNSIARSYAAKAHNVQWMKKYLIDFVQDLKLGDKILDLGCGPGSDAYLFSQEGLEVTGVDFSELMLEEARRRVPNAIFLNIDMLDIEFAAGSFDAFWAVGSLLHIKPDDLVELFRKVFLCLKSNAKGFISLKSFPSEIVKNRRDNLLNERSKYSINWDKSEFTKLLDIANFKILKSSETESRKKGNSFMPKELWLNIWIGK